MPVLVAALGYFVDIYDLVLFSIVRVPSLKALGIPEHELVQTGVLLLNMQMAGMLIGGVLWGILGDKKGRLKILFGSILLYSIANIANGFVASVPAYAAWRFIAGIGLAGELGAGITLVSESLAPHLRGYGTMIVASIGVSGAILANLVAGRFDWRNAYFIGGALGLFLLFLRVSVHESTMFARIASVENTKVSKGNFWALCTQKRHLFKYLRSIFIGIPIWFIVGILMTFSPEFAANLAITGPVSAGNAIMYCYLGLVFGDFASGLLSQLLQSRRKVLFVFLLLTAMSIISYFTLLHGGTPAQFYFICAALGFSGGYWAIFVTIAAEQFGTNLRATVATTAPNFVRGMVVPMTLAFQYGKQSVGILEAGAWVGALTWGVAFLCAVFLEETFGKSLDFIEDT